MYGLCRRQLLKRSANIKLAVPRQIHHHHSTRIQSLGTQTRRDFSIMPKRKSAAVAAEVEVNGLSVPGNGTQPPPLKRRQSSRKSVGDSVNPDKNVNVLDAPQALRASPDAEGRSERLDVEAAGMDVEKQVKEEEPPPAGLQASLGTKGKGQKNTSRQTKDEGRTCDQD